MSVRLALTRLTRLLPPAMYGSVQWMWMTSGRPCRRSAPAIGQEPARAGGVGADAHAQLLEAVREGALVGVGLRVVGQEQDLHGR